MQSRTVRRTYGTVCADKQKEMTGLEFVQGLLDRTLPLNTIAKTLGYEIDEAEHGRVVVTAEPRDIHLNPAGTVHGGLDRERPRQMQLVHPPHHRQIVRAHRRRPVIQRRTCHLQQPTLLHGRQHRVSTVH